MKPALDPVMQTSLRAKFQRLVDAVDEACADFYGERLISVAVFGSVARGTMRPDSDIDLLLVVDGLPNGRMSRVGELEAVERRLAPLMAETSRQGVSTEISPVFKTPRELAYGSPLFLDMTEAVLILRDRDALLHGYLERLRSRLKALGSRRIQKGGGYYWLLKPDLRPGEDFSL